MNKRLELLVERHAQLNAKADEMSLRRFLTPAQRSELKHVKVMRLYAREAIDKFLEREK